MKSNLFKGIKKHGISVIFSLPFLILFFVFTVIPVVIAIILSFTQYDILQPPQFIGLENYLMLFFEDDVFMIALKNTLLFALITVPVSMLSCLMVAWMINDFGPKTRALLTFVFYAPSISGGAMTVWMLIFGGDSYAVLNSVLMNYGFISSPIQWLSNPEYIFPVLVIVSIWSCLGLGFLTYVAAFRGIDPEQYEASEIDGVKNRIQQLWYITLPALRPQMLFNAITSITGAFSVGAVSSQLFGNPSKNYAGHTIVLHMQDYANIRFDLGVSCAMAVMLFFLMVGGNYILKLFISRVGR